MGLRIEVMSGPQDGQEATCPGLIALVGPSPESDLCLAHDPDGAPAGALLEWENGGFTLHDGEREELVADGELFRVGGTWLRARVVD